MAYGATSILVFSGHGSKPSQSALAQKATWAGIKLAKGDIILRPQAGRAREVMKGKAWGFPIGGAIVPGMPLRAVPGVTSESQYHVFQNIFLNQPSHCFLKWKRFTVLLN